ncbi:hypothetical protein ACNKHT_26030 [Shigella flexneri]
MLTPKMASGLQQGVKMSVIAQAGAKVVSPIIGGSSLADAKCYLRVAGIMAEYSQPDDMMVVSAAGSTTNQLINWLKLSETYCLLRIRFNKRCVAISAIRLAVCSPLEKPIASLALLSATLSAWRCC